MKITIDADTSSYTDIVVKDANGEVVFNGNLKLEPDWWVLYDIRQDYMGTIVKKWRGARGHLSALAAALDTIAKATGSTT